LWVLLTVGVAAQPAAAVGVLAGADVYDRLHFIGPGSIFGPSALAVAVVPDEGPRSQAGLKSMLVALLLLGLGPVLVHATAWAAFVRERGKLGRSPPRWRRARRRDRSPTRRAAAGRARRRGDGRRARAGAPGRGGQPVRG
jgi:multisubunit Na+/H+ antiporter MnhG subunit